MQALSTTLEARVLEIVARRAPYTVRARVVDEPDVPQSLAALYDQTTAHRCPRTGALSWREIPVSGAHCERTVWSGSLANVRLRAWHDSLHMDYGLALFNTRDELAVAKLQVRMVDGDRDRAILWADTGGQTLYFDRWGAFPEDQRAFVLEFLNRPSDALAMGPDHYHALDHADLEFERMTGDCERPTWVGEGPGVVEHPGPTTRELMSPAPFGRCSSCNRPLAGDGNHYCQ